MTNDANDTNDMVEDDHLFCVVIIFLTEALSMLSLGSLVSLASFVVSANR